MKLDKKLKALQFFNNCISFSRYYLTNITFEEYAIYLCLVKNTKSSITKYGSVYCIQIMTIFIKKYYK